jgi:hypothetical protein
VSENTDLQFDRAQFDGSGPERSCTTCKTPLVGAYYEVNGHLVCERCCFQLREGTPAGSRLGRVARAAGAGAVAALGGALIYWAILAATGYEFGLIAIVVGFAVGKAVRWGSRGRGGWAYQTLAIALTYLAIVSGYVPIIVQEIMKDKPAAQTQRAPQAGVVQVADTAKSTPAASESAPGVGVVLFAFAAVLLVACAAPFLAGLQNIIGLVIIGIGMYEAWKLNRRVPLVITGPHVLSPANAAARVQ